MFLPLLVSLIACDNSGNKGNGQPDLARTMSGQSCTPKRSECVTLTLLRVCPSDGSQWLAVQCNAGETCQNGACVAPTPGPAKICEPGETRCATVANMPDEVQVCNAAGTAFEKKESCPASSKCIGKGLCEGRCVVGSSTCLDPYTLATCSATGNQVDATRCADGETCVATQTDPFPTAACKPSDCTPGECQFLCGNQVDANADQERFVSECRETPQGRRWVAIACPSNEICAYRGSYCGGSEPDKKIDSIEIARDSTPYNAMCVPAPPANAVCTEGATNCDDTRTQLSTCVGGQWVTTACTTSAARPRLCAYHPSEGRDGCSDYECVLRADLMSYYGQSSYYSSPTYPYFSGFCTTTNEIRYCTSDLQLDTAQTCDGHCERVSQPPTSIAWIYPYGPYFNLPLTVINALLPNLNSASSGPGSCQANECTNGAKRCASKTASQTCVNGQWGPTTACTNCVQFYDQSTDLDTVLCSAATECIPGSTQCGSGATIAGLGDYTYFTGIRTCGPDGTFPATYTQCSVGACAQLVASGPGAFNGQATCLPQCVPNEIVCVNSESPNTSQTLSTLAGPPHGWPYQIKCTAQGRLSTSPADLVTCTSGQSCRRDVTGKSLGCVDCVGTQNEFGVPDERCSGSTPQTCTPSNTWPGSGTACGINSVCVVGNANEGAYCVEVN